MLEDKRPRVSFWLFVAALAALVVTLLLIHRADAHESWISRGGLKNGAGEWCCGADDCKSYPKALSSAKGWLLDAELVPFDEALPIVPPDGEVTVCRRPDGSRRCVFGLKPSF